MSNLAQSPCGISRLRKSGLTVRLWPNGELAFYHPKSDARGLSTRKKPLEVSQVSRLVNDKLGVSAEFFEAFLLGLSNVRNSDKVGSAREQYGLKGITSLGKRRVRNACHMLTRENGRYRLTFSTVTLPVLPDEDMMSIHMRWHKAIEYYRREMSRQLQRGALSGEIVGVSEIQEKRHESNGFPVLHAHFVFVGMGRSGGWVISPSRHDRIWRAAIQSITHGPLPPFATACRLESPRESVEGYLGKYMSKGAGVIGALVADGFEWAVPAQWWNCSRSLTQRMKGQMRVFQSGAHWLMEKVSESYEDFYEYYSVFYLEMPSGESVAMGSYGRLKPKANGLIRKVLGL